MSPPDSEVQERREALVVLLFEHYSSYLPNGQEIGPREGWLEGWVAAMATTPPLIDLDQKIERGMRLLDIEASAAWQAWRS